MGQVFCEWGHGSQIVGIKALRFNSLAEPRTGACSISEPWE